MANEFAKAPNSCELNSTLTRGWQVQVKTKGADAAAYKFVLGLTQWSVNVEKNSVDSTDLNSDGWTSETSVGRTLNVSGVTKYPKKGDLPLLNETMLMIMTAGEEIGENEQLDFRMWREDVDQGWEGTFNVKFTENSGDAAALRTANIELKANCAPSRIHSVEIGKEKGESVKVSDAELKLYLAGTNAKVGEDTSGSSSR